MKIVFLDSTAVPGVRRGPGSPAYFSRFAIQHLQRRGHEISIIGGYEDAMCLPADVVVAEWCNELAYQTATRQLKKLIIRMRGYDVYGPLDQLKWQNVDALVYESPLLKEIAEERFAGLRGFPSHVIASGVDLANIPWRDRAFIPEVAIEGQRYIGKKIVALIARTTSDKGYQLAYEWARTRPDVELHVTGALGDANPRLTSYLDYAAPPNVVVHGTVDTIPWLESIKADFLLSASIHESLGYVIAEAMAMGIKPLIHDAPGITKNWPLYLTWRSFDDLNRLMEDAYDSIGYREFIERRLDAKMCSADFTALVEAPSTRATSGGDIEGLRRSTYEHANRVFSIVRKAIGQPADMRTIDEVVLDYRSRLEPHSISSTERYGIAMATAVAHFNHENWTDAEVWACRAMMDYARPDAMCLMGECADARGAVEDALQWYEAACAMVDVADRYRFPELVQNRFQRLSDLKRAATVVLTPAPAPERYIVIVTVRNGAKWIQRCLESIRTQTVKNFECIVVDDCSTDGTGEIAEQFGNPEDGGLDDDRFLVQRNTVRRFQAYNTVQAARQYATRPDDVVMLIDGDDWLLHDRAFEVIRDAYMKGAWMTYGCLVESAGQPTRFGYYPLNVARTSAFREHVWCATPPRTFRRFLLDELKDDDFTLDGKWPEMAGDVCVYTPIMELAAERTVGIREAIYVYNTETPDSEHKIDPYETTRIRDLLLQRPPKKRLER